MATPGSPGKARKSSESGAGSTNRDEKVPQTEVSHFGDDESGDGPKPRLHAKTYLAIFSICLIYFVQIYNIVGTGVVRCLFWRCVVRKEN